MADEQQPIPSWAMMSPEGAQYPYGGLPIVGPWMGRLGMVREILTQPCSPEPAMWVSAFFDKGLPKFLWSALKPGPRDYADIRRPRSSPGHGRRRRFTFDVQDVLSGELADTEAQGWAKFLLNPVIAELLKAEFWFLIASATADGALWWTSTAYRYAGCQGSSGGYADSSAIPGYCTTGGYFTAWAPSSHEFILNDDIAMTYPAGMNVWGGYGIDTGPDPFTGDPPEEIDWELIHLPLGEVVQTRTAKLNQDGSRTAKGIISPQFKEANRGGSLVIRGNPTRPVWCTGGYWNLYGNDPTDGIGPDP